MRTLSGKHDYTQASALHWLILRWHALLASMPPTERQATIERARELAALRPWSYLARHLGALYPTK